MENRKGRCEIHNGLSYSLTKIYFEHQTLFSRGRNWFRPLLLANNPE